MRANIFMPKVRIGIVGAGATVEWEILPVLTGPDMTLPPDDGAWWSRRPVAGSDIRWQPPAQPDIVAISDAEEEKAARLARAYRIHATHSDWRAMLDQNALDVVFCERAASLEFDELLAHAARRGVRCLWFDEPPVAAYELMLHLHALAAARGVLLWWARPARHAAAHRAARKLLQKGDIGDVTALALRWSTPFNVQPDAPLAASCAAIDLLLACAGAAPVEVMAREAKGVTTLWLSFAGGASATAIFAASDIWNSPLPRLEIIGTQGRFLVCEAGRRMAMLQPREGTRWIEPPGLASHVSAANITGVAEDLKLFLAAGASAKPTHAPEANDREAARVLQVLEAAAQSQKLGGVVALESLRHHALATSPALPGVSGQADSLPVLTLPLHL